jgi:hypothetical protein
MFVQYKISLLILIKCLPVAVIGVLRAEVSTGLRAQRAPKRCVGRMKNETGEHFIVKSKKTILLEGVLNRQQTLLGAVKNKIIHKMSLHHLNFIYDQENRNQVKNCLQRLLINKTNNCVCSYVNKCNSKNNINFFNAAIIGVSVFSKIVNGVHTYIDIGTLLASFHTDKQ